MKVREIMTPDPATCTPDTSLEEVARVMEQRDCGSLPVVTAAGTGVVGVVTDRDIVIRIVSKRRNPLDLPAESCMTSPAITIMDDADADECLKLMEVKRIRRVPVVDARGRLVGIVAQADIARHESRKDTGELVRDLSEPVR
jgi:CBS domain-containing protein